MRRWGPILGASLAMLLMGSSCPSQTEFDNLKQQVTTLQAQVTTLQANHDLVVTQLKDWSDEVYKWQLKTGKAVCDIVAKNGPLSKYASDTKLACGPGDGLTPDPPPDWGHS